ncbi:hypothetical protein BJX70DRAFT_401538 [Aspergillus crustosus]
MVYGPKDLEQAKRLFLDPSEKVIKQIIEKERYNLRKRDKSRRLLSTWRDDDSETYQLSKKRKSRKMKRKNNPATVDEVGTAKKRCKSLTSGVAIKAETEVEPEVETVADEEVETISEEFLDSLPLLEESDALAGELDGTVADKTNGTGQETDEIDIDESEQQSLEEGPLKEKQASVQGFGGDESRESHSPEKQDGLEEASPGLQHTIAQIVHPDNVEEPEVEPDSKHGENVADEKPEGSPAQLDGQHDGETKDDFDGKLRETLNFDIEEDSTIHGCLEECDISGTLAMNEVPTVKNSEGSSAEGKSLVKDQQGSSELRDAVPIQQQLDYSQDAEEGADVPKVEEMVEAQPKTDIGPLLDVVFEALDTTKTNTAYTALPVGQNDESFKDDPTPKPAESCPWCEDFAYGIIGLGSHPVERIAATRAARFTTSSTKRRKVAEPRRPGPGLSASQPGRRHASASSRSPSRPRPSPTSASNRSQSSSASPPPRYIPAHLQDEVLGTRPQSNTARLPTPDSPTSTTDYPAVACAGLSIVSDTPTDMSDSEKRDDSVSPPGRDVRSASPATKRAAPEAEQDVEMNQGSTEKETQPLSENADQMDTTGSDEDSPVNDGNSASDNAYQTPSSMSTYTAPVAETQDETTTEASVAPDERPSYDDQVARVTQSTMQPLQNGQKGYVVSMSWLKRVLSRSPTHADKIDKTATEGEVGPVDNSDLVLVTDPVNIGLKDEHDQPFIPLRPGLMMGEDFEVIPQEGWDLIMKWYGLAEQSPAIVRYAHNTNPSGDLENIQYEINPPIYTILRLPHPSAPAQAALKGNTQPPPKTLASRHANFQDWLRRAKKLVNVDPLGRVRVWRILGGLGSAAASTTITPAASRSTSPAPFSPLVSSAGNSYIIDVNTFLNLSEGSQRELIEAKDQTFNSKYNGKMTLDIAGLAESSVIVLEESVLNENVEWVSELSKQSLNRLGVPTGNLKPNVPSKLKTKSPVTSGRSSPVLEPVRRGRKDGKPRGNTGLSNLGNTCYMNSALQCVRSVEELTYYFLNDVYKRDLNPSNPLAHNGDVAKAYANLLRMMFDEAGSSSFAPRQLKSTIGRYGPAFSGYGQQDSQEFLLFLLDGLQEDLNRIQKKPYIEKPDSTDDMVNDKQALKDFANKCWDIYKARNDSVITDLFAGMYKSTLVCPVCDKVSIIFDPFNNLTLQLPIENLWNKSIFYFPLHKKPIIIDIEIDKNSSIKALKELVAKKAGSNTDRLLMSEIYKYKFYKMFDNTTSIAECQIGESDEIGIFEVESVPTNYNPDKPTKTSYFSYGRTNSEDVPSFDSPKADRMVISLFNRTERQQRSSYRPQRNFFGVPSYLVINRDEATDYDSILRKVLAEVATMTTLEFLNDEASEAQETGEDSDTVIMNEDDAESAHSKIKTTSVDGEEGMIDVSMRDASDHGDAADESTPAPGVESAIPAKFHSLFDIRVVRTNEAVPLGFSSIDENKEYTKMTSRIQAKPTVKEAGSDDEAAEEHIEDESDDEIDMLTPKERKTTPKPEPQGPLINPGEAIVLDWTEDAYDALFGGDHKDPNGVRGAPTWTSIERMPDPELTNKRMLRQKRKKKGITLYECLDEFNKEEILSENDAWYCPRCKEHRRASKKFELWKTPDILVMHLKRFSASRGFRDKLDIMVDFPTENLDLTGRVESPEDGKSLIYDLFAVDNHYGGLGGGHYTAYAKNFMTGLWNEYNDSSVSRPIDAQNAVTSSAYLLFYRRRSEKPLGGKVLQEVTESSTRPGSSASDSQGESRGPSPSGEGLRLGGSSLNGSSSALAGVGAAHQSGDGGLRIGTRKSRDDEDSPPEYSNGLSYGETTVSGPNRLEGMNNYDEDDYGSGSLAINPLRPHTPPSWSFNRVTDAHPFSQMTELPGGTLSDDDLLDDDASDKAVGGGDISDSDFRMASLTDSPPFQGQPYHPGTPMEESTIPDLAPPDAADDNDDELPVVELHVADEDRLTSD